MFILETLSYSLEEMLCFQNKFAFFECRRATGFYHKNGPTCRAESEKKIKNCVLQYPELWDTRPLVYHALSKKGREMEGDQPVAKFARIFDSDDYSLS